MNSSEVRASPVKIQVIFARTIWDPYVKGFCCSSSYASQLLHTRYLEAKHPYFWPFWGPSIVIIASASFAWRYCPRVVSHWFHPSQAAILNPRLDFLFEVCLLPQSQNHMNVISPKPVVLSSRGGWWSLKGNHGPHGLCVLSLRERALWEGCRLRLDVHHAFCLILLYCVKHSGPILRCF